MKNVVDKLDRDKLELYTIVKEKCKSLQNNLLQIKPPKRLRQRRWDALGSGWKWLAGSPDADDLRIINATLNGLINENNQQYQVNEQINNRIRLLTNTINEVITNTAMANKVVLSELEVMMAIIHIDTLNAIIEDIQDAIVRTKIALPSNKVLSLKEIIGLKNLLTEQGVNITVLDEALKFVKPKIAICNETLLYILEVPKLEKETSTTIRITPLVVNNTIIDSYPQYIIKNKQKLFITTNYDNYVQRYSDIKEFKDKCIEPLVMGKQSNCNVTSETNTAIQWISEGKILINNGKNAKLSTDCGPDDRNMTGNFLITIENCTATINSEVFQAYEIRTENEEIQGALHSIQIIRQMKSVQNMTAIEQDTIKNRNLLEEVSLKQHHHQKWIWSLSGGLSFSSICVVMALSYMFLRKCSIIKKVQGPSKLEDTKVTYNDLLRKAGVILKVEDDFSPPQGGVTVP